MLNGADKVGINTGAIKNPKVITELMELFGRQCVVVAVDAKRNFDTKDSSKNTFSEDGKNFGLKFSFMVEKKELELMQLNGQMKQKN